jgi:hypothetical protein
MTAVMTEPAEVTVRGIAKRAADAATRRPASLRMPVESRRVLRIERRRGEILLVETDGKTFAPCATERLARQLRAAYAP